MTHELDNEFRVELESAIAGFGLDPLTDEQAGQLVKHYALLCRWNQRVNLTRIIEPGEAAKLHYAESLFCTKFIADARTVLDIGSGAGFPAIPLAVARAETRVSALEANQKKALFLKEVKDELELENLEVANARLEEFDWGGYDLLTSRALERGEAIFPSVIRVLRPQQRFMVYCTSELLAKLMNHVAQEYRIERHPIPFSEDRIIAVFARGLTVTQAQPANGPESLGLRESE
jgi:16S rRNA (guanine(527)-N(7))-methyltransferase RsmG